MTSSKTSDKSRATKGTSMEKKSQTKNKKNKQSNLKPNNNGSHNDDEPEVLIVPPSSSSDSLNKDEEEAKRSDITNQQSDKAKENVKKKKKKNSKKEMIDKSNSDTNSENVLYTFPMNRINRIIKGEDSDIRVTQEAVFLINKASEKFLELFCEEAYACSVLDHKKLIGYQHLSSVVGKRRRFDFLSDFVPEQVKAEDALKEAMPAET